MAVEQRRPPLKEPKKPMIDVSEPIWGQTHGTFATQAISDRSARCPDNAVALPSDRCVKEAKDWVDFNEK